MPFYEYPCASNGRTLEVRHGMSERLRTWGELAGAARVDVGDTPAGAPVERILSTPVPLTATEGDAGFEGCGGSCACAARH